MSTTQHSQSAVPPFQLTAIDSWEEFLDKPESAAIVRAHDNWAARLALTVLSEYQGQRTWVLKGVPCWQCMGLSSKPLEDTSDDSNRYDKDDSDRHVEEDLDRHDDDGSKSSKVGAKLPPGHMFIW